MCVSVNVQVGLDRNLGRNLDRNLLTALKLTWDSEYGRKLTRSRTEPLKHTWLLHGDVYSIYRGQTQREGRRANRKRRWV